MRISDFGFGIADFLMLPECNSFRQRDPYAIALLRERIRLGGSRSIKQTV